MGSAWAAAAAHHQGTIREDCRSRPPSNGSPTRDTEAEIQIVREKRNIVLLLYMYCTGVTGVFHRSPFYSSGSHVFTVVCMQAQKSLPPPQLESVISLEIAQVFLVSIQLTLSQVSRVGKKACSFASLARSHEAGQWRASGAKARLAYSPKRSS